MAAASRCPTSGTRPTSDTSSTGMENSESSRTSSSGDTEEKSWRENPWSLSHNAREILFFQNSSNSLCNGFRFRLQKSLVFYVTENDRFFKFFLMKKSKVLYLRAFSRKGFTVEFFHERTIPLRFFTKGLMKSRDSQNYRWYPGNLWIQCLSWGISFFKGGFAGRFFKCFSQIFFLDPVKSMRCV